MKNVDYLHTDPHPASVLVLGTRVCECWSVVANDGPAALMEYSGPSAKMEPWGARR